MAAPIICYRNLLTATGATLTASSTDADFAVSNLLDLRSYTLWKAGALASPQYLDLDLGASGSAAADSITLVNHNIVALVGQIKVYADTVTPPVAVAQAAYTPTYDNVEMKTFTSPGAKRYWRIEFSKGAPFASAPYVSAILLGMKMSLPEFLSPDVDPFFRQVEIEGQTSHGGHYLGGAARGVRRRGTMSFGGPAGIVRTFFTSDLNDFVTNHAQLRYPFAFILDSDDSELSRPLWLMVPLDQEVPRMPVGGVYARMQLTLPVIEAMMEDP